MKKARNPGLESPWVEALRWALIGVVICSLTVTLATRTFHESVSHTVAAKSGRAEAIRQHMDRDAVRWIAPIPRFAFEEAPTFYPHVSPAGPPMRVVLLGESLYNRPPPSC